jgi:TRAP-type C4-dicarboxylate transport system permease large subunit
MQFMLVVNLFFLVLGCLLDGSVMMLVFVPLLIQSAFVPLCLCAFVSL